ncbi:MAG: ribose 5-phosphate isomerase B [Alphaproteobacteria bacterium CG_4_10_14_0_2_um_filter_63_37]|nr:MAG: ribose 5-phosphate isomerase B [Proteobacteria bacterium CG1_02_64_396]PJA25978.1 MAG: ribose 5-phosphate isomerase B [Alphaproteobacteria bacterium CG_4_10_14_0_2_um_filter_63_37]
MPIAIASDHGGFGLKSHLIDYLASREGVEVVDLGVKTPDSVDYPEYAAKLCRAVLDGQVERGILLCGTGIGISMAANRFEGIRAALCHDEFTARLSRLHNDANVLVLGGRILGVGLAEAIVDVWLETPFEGGRHRRRVEAIEKVKSF